MDLGSHIGAAWHPFDSGEHPYLSTRLGVIHLHFTCFEREVRNNEKAAISHAYIFEDDADEVKIERLHDLLTQQPCNRTGRGCCNETLNSWVECMSSCHKVLALYIAICFPEKAESSYYASNEDVINDDFKKYLEQAVHRGSLLTRKM